MRLWVTLIVLSLMATACAADSVEPSSTTAAVATDSTTIEVAPTNTPGTAESTEPSAATDAEFVLSTVSFGEDGVVVITNMGDGPGSLEGHYLCQRPNYFGLEDVVVPAGESYTFSATTEIGLLKPTGGEVGLYTSTDFANSDEILSYVEWGNEGHGRSSVAVAAGIWGGFVATTDSTDGIETTAVPAINSNQWETVGG